MIEVRNVTKTFEGFHALDDISLTIPNGSVYGLVGPNGAGKTTLIKHLQGIYRQDRGTITVDGEPIWENPAVKSRLVSIPDELYYNSQTTVEDMMRFYKGIYPAFSKERFDKMQKIFGIDPRKQIRKLSKGMQKQVWFWITLSTMPEYLILDEPVDGLDPMMRRNVWSLVLNDVSEHGLTVMVSSHNLRELEDVCDNVGIMDHGKMVLERSLEQLQDNIVKLQLVFPDWITEIPSDIDYMHAEKVGRVVTLIIRKSADEACNMVQKYEPLFVDAIPLTLEEIFIYELGGDKDAVKEFIL
ncbi:MAG: ABC transporter ATP-binding protein [Dehalococcoidales bacterium]|nr:ABC transporter ATP-binding protein [Dehalococcoidales bacterium]